MRRQTQPHGLAARWPLGLLDIDPYRLPARYALPVDSDAVKAPQALDLIEINQGAIAVEHQVSGHPSVRRALPLDGFSGIAIRIESLDDAIDGFAISINLHHPDPKLCFPLHMSYDMSDVGARWQSWGRALRLPLLLPALDGSWREPIDRFGKLKVNPPHLRPVRLALNARRSAISSVREIGDPNLVHCIAGEELIARNQFSAITRIAEARGARPVILCRGPLCLILTNCPVTGHDLIPPDSFSVERRKLMRFLGAEVVLMPAKEKGTGMVKKTQELARTHGWFLTRQFIAELSV